MNRLRHGQRGVVLILILACLAIAAVLLTIGVKLAVTNHRLTQTLGWKVQARWLAESALQRAAAKLAADAEYTGETWKIPAQDLGGQYSGIVKIEIKPVPDQTKQRQLKVEAIFPDDPFDRVQFSKQLTLELP
jgi:hypothetical protein